jgi:hypothetical protein
MLGNLKIFRPEPLPNLPAGRQVEKLLSEPQRNSESRRLSGLMGFASVPILQNPLFKQHLPWASSTFTPLLSFNLSSLLLIKYKQKCKRMNFRPMY